MGDQDTETEWDGYSIYNKVSAEIHDSVTDAIDAYATIASAHSEGEKVRPGEAAEAKSQILGAAMRFVVELDIHSGAADQLDFGEIHERWDGAGDDTGYIQRLREAQLVSPSTDMDWIQEFVRDIHAVAFELGYIKAGREETVQDNTPDGTSQDMLQDVIPNATS